MSAAGLEWTEFSFSVARAAALTLSEDATATREDAMKFLAFAAERAPEGPDAYAVARTRGADLRAAHVGPLVPRTTRVNPALDFVSVLSRAEAERVAAQLGDDFEVVLYDDLPKKCASHLFEVANTFDKHAAKQRQKAETLKREVEAYRS